MSSDNSSNDVMFHFRHLIAVGRQWRFVDFETSTMPDIVHL